MPYRDANGHFISREEAIRQGIITEDAPEEEPTTLADEMPDEEYGEEAEPERPHFGEEQRQNTESVFIDMGRGGEPAEVQSDAPFVPTLERLSEEAHYGGYFRIFLNGNEVINPEDSPETIQPGMRISITSYDKVG